MNSGFVYNRSEEEKMTDEITTPQTGKKLNIAAVISLISGILTYAFYIFGSLVDINFIAAVILAPITAIIAIITGSAAKRKIRQSDGSLGGSRMANVGLWLGWIYLIICVVVIVLMLIIGGAVISSISGLFG